MLFKMKRKINRIYQRLIRRRMGAKNRKKCSVTFQFLMKMASLATIQIKNMTDKNTIRGDTNKIRKNTTR